MRYARVAATAIVALIVAVIVALVLAATGDATAAAARSDAEASLDRSAAGPRADYVGGVDLRVVGRGFGHGRGMSQYGAQARALAGQTTGHILDFYYPGTRVGAAHGRVRILLSSSPGPGLVVSAQHGLSVRRVSTGAQWQLPELAGVDRWRLRWTAASTTTLELHRRDGWEPSPRARWSSIGGAAEMVGGGPVELGRAGGPVSYRGALRTYGGDPGTMSVVNELAMNRYLFGVVPRESPASWEPAALQAQAVAARTYAQFHRQRARAGNAGYDLCDTTSCQVYGGKEDEVTTTNQAVRATDRVIRTWDGEPIVAEFSSSNGGQAVGSSLPYQRFGTDRYDRWSGNPNRSWSTTVDGDRVASTWGLGRLSDVRAVSRDGQGEWGGRVTSLRLVGTTRSVTVSGDALRLGLGLRSTYVDITVV